MNFFAIINAIKLVFQLLPVIHQAVDQIEELLPQGGIGAQKLEMVKTILEKTMSTYGVAGDLFNGVWPTISSLIAMFVSQKKTLAPVVEKSINADGSPLVIG